MSNSGKMICVLGCWVAMGVAAFTGCSAEVASGTDSNTHWLDQCSSDAQCGDLKCFCGLCTKPCAGDEACSALGSNTTCEGRPFGCEVAGSVCLATCETSMDCPAGLRCEAGQCTSQTMGAGMEQDSGVGEPPIPQDGGGTYDPCAPMDARSSGQRCAGRVGFTWDGDSCEPVECSCVGTDCDRLYPTEADCYSARSSCPETTPELCDLPLDSGPCDGASTRYGYSPEAGACIAFTWGLCEGNENNFPTLEECNTVCAGRADVCRMCPNADCSATSTDPPPSCASCPKNRDSNGDPCTVKGLECTFLPACGAVQCLCAENGSGELVWQCLGNLC